ncbi:MAG: ABC transporter substrate-binding protein [Firmicutes bacterium]|nr:ABC transporter substrate-binding protein [Bacillota bacterium]
MTPVAKIKAWTLAAGIAALLAGCNSPPLKATAPPYVYDTTLTVVTPAVTNINPLTSLTAGNQLFDQMVYQTLVSLSPRGRAEPGLATSWHSGAHGRNWSIKLNPFAKWWNGRPVTARDVAWTLALYQNPASGFKAWRELSNIKTVAVRSPTTLTIQLKRADPDFVANVLSPAGHVYILPRFLLGRTPIARVKRAVWLNQIKDVVGSGPYRPIDWTDRDMVWIAYPHYLYGPPHVKYLAWWWRGVPPHPPELSWSETRRPYVASRQRIVSGRSIQEWVLAIHSPPSSGRGWNLLEMLRLATNARSLPGIPATGVAATSHTTPARFRRRMRHWGYRQTSRGWVRRGSKIPLTVSLAVPPSDFGRQLARSLTHEWEAEGIRVVLRSRKERAEVALAPVLATPVPEPLAPNQIALVWEPEYWMVSRRLDHWSANPWEPFNQVQAWRLLPSKPRSH